MALREKLRRRLFAVQQRIAITTPEAAVLLGLIAIMTVGLISGHVAGKLGGVDTSHYESLAASIQAGAAMTVEEAIAALPAEAAPEPVESPRPAVAASSPVNRAPVRLDPNTASSQALQRLPGIGPALAQRIIDYREEVGRFRAPRDIMAVRGIGPRTFERMEPYLFVAYFEEGLPVAQDERASGGTGSDSIAAPSPP